MTVHFGGNTFSCLKAVRQGKQAVLHMEDGGVVTFEGVNDWGAFLLDGGAWSNPDVTPAEQLRADVDFLAIMTGVSL